MKKISLLLLVICLSIPSFAQEGQGLDNRFYFRIGYSKPANSYLGYNNSPYQEYISTTGAVFEIGSIFMLNNLDLGEGLRIGINVDYAEIAYHQFTYDDSFEEVILRMGQISSKAGPSISFSPVNRLVFDGFFKLKIPWIAGAYFQADDPDIDEEWYSGAIGIGFSTGINIRYGALMLGFDYSTNTIKMNNSEDSEDYLGNTLDISDDSDKTKIAYYNFTIGLNF